MAYAIDDLHRILGPALQAAQTDQKLIYASALLAELAYYHVPEWEVDAARRRALLLPVGVPSLARFLRRVRGTHVKAILGERKGERAEIFVVETRDIIAVGMTVGTTLCVAMRGTIFLSDYDWWVNLRARLTRSYSRHLRGSYHRGFLTESVRVCRLIMDEINKLRTPVDRLHLCGHSLGGAVAAISERLLAGACAPQRSSSVVFGAPRYCAADAHLGTRRWNQPVHIRRPRDLVPTVPPHALGYADPLDERTTDGRLYTAPPPARWRTLFVLPWVWFIGTVAAPHSMTRYRRETGHAAAEPLADARLTDRSPISAANLG
jgi:hypothetical protein